MTRKRLRPAYSPDELARIYARPHDHRQFRDHHLRVAATIEVARWLAQDSPVTRAADLSCGNGEILKSVEAEERWFGDLAPGYELVGPIDQTIDLIPAVDMFVCSETLEHLDDPDQALKAIRGKTGTLVLSTPVDAWYDDNPEHYWAWSRQDVEDMLAAAGFRPVVYASVDFRGLHPQLYQFGIWGVR